MADLQKIEAGIDPEELREIERQIDDITQKHRIDTGSTPMNPLRGELGFPLTVNLLMLVIAAGALLGVFIYFNREQSNIFHNGVTYSSVEGRLLKTLRDDASSNISSKEKELVDIRNQLLNLEEEYRMVIDSLDGEERERYEAEYRKNRLEYQEQIRLLNRERQGLQDDLQSRENEVYLASSSGQYSSLSTEEEAAVSMLNNMSSGSEEKRMRDAQIQSMYNQIQLSYNREDWEEVIRQSELLTSYLSRYPQEGIESAEQIGIDLFLSASLERAARMELERLNTQIPPAEDDDEKNAMAAELVLLREQLEAANAASAVAADQLAALRLSLENVQAGQSAAALSSAADIAALRTSHAAEIERINSGAVIERTRLEERIRLLENRLNMSEEERAALNENLSALATGGAQSRELSAAEIAALQTRIRELEGERVSLNRNLENLRSQYNDLYILEESERIPAAAYWALIAAYKSYESSEGALPDLKNFLGDGEPKNSFPEFNNMVIRMSDQILRAGNRDGIANVTHILEVTLRITDQETRRRYLEAMKMRYPNQSEVNAFIDILLLHLGV
ncbi:MAG: V-type ATPase subunit a family protein [Treponema sp.]|nr:V-type ATPase subunit a family protein [Treponema sp.]